MEVNFAGKHGWTVTNTMKTHALNSLKKIDKLFKDSSSIRIDADIEIEGNKLHIEYYDNSELERAGRVDRRIAQSMVKYKELSAEDIKPTSEEDAIYQMEMLGHDFFVFIRAEDLINCVLYKRIKGN